MTLILDGIGVSPGIAIGRALPIARGESEVYEQRIPAELIEDEVERLRQVLDRTRRQLRAMREQIPDETAADVTAFVDTHLLMLEDRVLNEGVIDIVRELGCNAEWALKLQRDRLIAVFDGMDDPYLRTRRDDVDHVVQRIQRLLLNPDADDRVAPEFEDLRGRVVVVDDLTPEDIVLLHQAKAAAFVTEYGGPLSHTAILARSLGLPAIVGLREARRLLTEDETVVVDGALGMLVAGADDALMRRFRMRRRDLLRHRRELALLRERPAISRDGESVTLELNIELEDDIRAVREVGAEGVGLYRTEFLYLNRDTPPDEEEQLAAYRKVVRALKGRPLTIRTLDLGGEKEFGTDPLASTSPNPALGLRAIRRCLRHPAIFLPQLRAILRASAYGPVRLMFPMLTAVSEVEQALAMLQLCRQSLAQEGLAFNHLMPVGCMIETPAAALAADAFAARLSFLSIGTNDLIQYTLAIDRVDDEVNYLYDPLHPAVLRLIYGTIRAGRKAGVPVAMCGEMAGDPRYTRLLLGFGLRDFSTRAGTLPEVKRIVNQTHIGEIRPQVMRMLRARDPDDIAALLEQINNGVVDKLAYPD
ncbi:MAG: phosphoenolpyruvate--protein phosphotransferase [Chromatiales bacterium]|jgi:phosphotransferase system enzyme I (PtsI)|nr:phosphoenolpyruvate--protein phosphotransferase [Chromatiales bacterium]MDX9766390.1 phosphoenolpyruvate--protein phosphotransferase [Ectothiorhodospiraceae bacterium]